MTEEPSEDASGADTAGSLRSENHTPRASTGVRAGLLRRPCRRLARLVDPAPSPLHGVAFGLRRSRCLPGANRQRDAAGGHVVGVLPAVGLAAHSLDELNGRPLGTHIPNGVLVAVTVIGLAAAVALGIAGVSCVGWALVPFLVLGPFLVVAYNFELFGGVIHNDAGFALAWGSFPVLVAYVAQTGRLVIAPVIAAAATFALSAAQRQLSTRARLIRRRRRGGGRSDHAWPTVRCSRSMSGCCWLRWSGPCLRCRGLSCFWLRRWPYSRLG